MIKIVPCRRVSFLRPANAIEDIQKALVMGDKSLLPGLVLKEAMRRVVKPEGALIEINAEEQGEVSEYGKFVRRSGRLRDG
jgi:hypothetical protein